MIPGTTTMNPHTNMNRTPVEDPNVVKRTERNGKVDYDSGKRTGIHYRVIPTDAVQVNAMRLLHPEIDRFAFAAGAGHGICLTEIGMERFEAMIRRENG